MSNVLKLIKLQNNWNRNDKLDKKLKGGEPCNSKVKGKASLTCVFVVSSLLVDLLLSGISDKFEITKRNGKIYLTANFVILRTKDLMNSYYENTTIKQLWRLQQ